MPPPSSDFNLKISVEFSRFIAILRFMQRQPKSTSIWFFAAFVLFSVGGISEEAFAYPEYAAYAGSNCMACHVGPLGGFGRKPVSMNDPGYISDKVSMSGDFQFMILQDERDPGANRLVLFPMQAALHMAFTLKPTITLAGSLDFGTVREIYAMLHNEAQTMYARAGFFTLPFGLMFPDHTAFIKEGRVKSGPRNFTEEGTGAGLFSVRYKDSGVEAGLSGKPFFLNLSVTSGVVGQESRSLPSSQSGSKRALTRRAGFITKNFSLGASMYNNDNELLDRRIMRYGVFGWARAGKFVLIAEHDEGEDEKYTVAGSTQINATYAELVYATPWLSKKGSTSYAKLRYERLDPNRSLDDDLLQRWILSYRLMPMDYMSIETFYRKNLEQPTEANNDDIYILTHLFF